MGSSLGDYFVESDSLVDGGPAGYVCVLQGDADPFGVWLRHPEVFEAVGDHERESVSPLGVEELVGPGCCALAVTCGW